jgi:hypothetical protein
MAVQRVNHNTGICLAELMMAMAAGLVILSAAVQALTHFQKRLWTQQDAIARHQDLRIGLEVMEAELRLAGTGALPFNPALLKVKPQEIEFLANVAGLATTLTEPASPTQSQLRVNDGTDWSGGKRVVICGIDQCVEGRLARDGQRQTLNLMGPLGQAFPMGSLVFVSNEVRYYMGKDRLGRASLMRQVDGGTNSLIGDVTLFQFAYLAKDGRPTQDPARVARVRINLAVGQGRRIMTSEVSLRSS